LVKGADERVGISVAEQIAGLVQLERGLLQVVLCHFTASFFHQVLKSKLFGEEGHAPRDGEGREAGIRAEGGESFRWKGGPLRDR
jgi:hypothetical protein